jgi:quercetin dioxygenase-like cupin family protein
MTQATRYLRLPFDFDPVRLEQDLCRVQAQRWSNHYNDQAHVARWTCLALRSGSGRAEDIAACAPAYSDTPVLDRCPYFREVLSHFACELQAVRLMALEAGGRILPHTDPGGGFEDGLARLHVPIVTDARVLFELDGERVHFSAGATWYMNANCRHAVYNGSARDRVHLVIDCVPNDWLRQVFVAAGWRANPAPKYGDPNINDANVAHIIAALRAMGHPEAERLELIRANGAA